MRCARLGLPAVLLAAACAGPAARPPLPEPPPFRSVERLAPEDWPRVADDLDLPSLERAAAASLAYLKAKDGSWLPLGDRRIGARHWADSVSELVRLRRELGAGPELERALREGFDLYRIRKSSVSAAHYSAYYQPILPASAEPDAEYRYPLYKRPADMVEADLGAFDPALRGKTAIGRLKDGRFVPYFDRRDIDVRESLKGRGLELAWLRSQFDRLNIHIQGSGLLQFRDGSEVMARFAATNGHKYESVGLAVAGSGAMRRDEITAETLRRYLEEHPEGESWLLARNPRYTFFSLIELPKGSEPDGSMGRPLTPGRSAAMDPEIVPLGAPAFAVLPMVQSDAQGRLLGRRETRRFLFCQDTGGAIKGPGRVDLYLGHGPQAEATARAVWEAGELYVLVKKLPPRTL